MSIVMMMGAAAVVGAGGSPKAQNITINVFHTSGSNSRAEFNVQRDGDINRINPSQVDIGDYVGSGLPDANIGLLYEVRVIQTSGDTLTGANAGLNTWLQINGTLGWGFNDSPGQFKDFGGNWEVREIADVSNTSGVKSVSLNTEDGS